MKRHDYSLRIGVLMFLSISALFLLMKVLNLEHITELRFLNIVLVAYFSNRLAKMYVIDENKIEYLFGLRSIFSANVVNVVLSILGLSLYISLIDPEFIHSFKNGLMIGGEVSLSKIAVGLFMEGIAGSAIVSFTLMQYWKGVKRSTKNIDLTNI